MKQQLVIGILCVIILVYGTPIFAKDATKANYVAGEVLVKFKDNDFAAAAMSRLNSSLGIIRLAEFETVRIQQVRLPAHIGVEEAIEYYRQDPNVEYAEPNYIVHASAVPNDANFAQLWGLNNTGQSVNGMIGSADADIDAVEAWEIETGESNPVVVAVVDSGIAYDHPDLKPNIWQNPGEINCEDKIDDDGNGYIDDCHGWDFIGDDNDPTDYNNFLGRTGHGSHVAGTIAAVGNNLTGITGVMWRAQIMPLRFLGVSGSGSTADAIAAIEYANANGADVINNSWGGVGFSQALKDVIDQSRAVVVCAAGNDGRNNDLIPDYPASFSSPNIISVAATDSSDDLAFFSNYGPTSVDVAAPGVNTLSTLPDYSTSTAVAVYRENFDAPGTTLQSIGWTTGGGSLAGPSTWEITRNNAAQRNGLEDSPGGDYENNTSSWVGYTNSGTPLQSVKDNLYTLAFRWKGRLEQGRDFLDITASIDSTRWVPVDGRTGISLQFTDDSTAELTVLADITDAFYFGFGLSSNAVNTDEGVFIDEVELSSEPITIRGYNYNYKSGTSMATPHVSGIAGLLKALNPSLTNLEIKAAILKSVDLVSSLENKITTGGRVNAHKALLAAQQSMQSVR